MFEFWPLIAAFGAVMLLVAAREYASGHRHNAGLLVALGAGGMLTGAAVWLA